MRRTMAIAAVVLALAALALSQVPRMWASQSRGTEQEVRQMVQTHRQAVQERDIATLERIWGDEYTYTDVNGNFLTKAQRIANIQSGATRINTSVPEEDHTVHMYGNVAVVQSYFTLQGQYSGQGTSGAIRSLHVWVKRQGQWQLVAHQATRVAEP